MPLWQHACPACLCSDAGQLLHLTIACCSPPSLQSAARHAAYAQKFAEKVAEERQREDELHGSPRWGAERQTWKCLC